MDSQDIFTELENWSSDILRTLSSEEDCSEAFRSAALALLAYRATQDGEIVLTSKMLHDAASNGYEGWSKKQLACLGIPWPPPKGWLRSLHGKRVQSDDWRRFLNLRKPNHSVN